MSSPGNLAISNVELNTAQSSTSRRRVTAAAQEFESVLVGQWLNSAESSFGTVPGSEEPEDAGASQMNEFAMQHLASEITRRGGIGIAHLVEAGLLKANTPPDKLASTIHTSQIEE